MELSGKSVSNIYSIKDKAGEDYFFEKWEAASIFSANPLLIYFFKEPVSSIKPEDFDLVKSSFLNIYELQTPYIYKPFETGVHEGYLFFTYLSIENVTLRTLLDTQIALPMTIYLKIIINVLRALVKLESKGLSHNLITPDAVWLTETGPEITNIKLSGAMDHLLWPYLGTGKDPFIKEYSGYLRKEFRLSKKLTSSIDNDIYASGVILYEMIQSKKYKSSDDLSFPEDVPRWLSSLTESMIKKPESFQSVNELLGIFLDNAPERSILEDSIENRIVETQQGGNFNKLLDPDEEALPVEELEPGEGVQINTPSMVVKNIVSFIFSLFRKKKKKIADKPSMEDTEIYEEEPLPAVKEPDDTVIKSPDSGFDKRAVSSTENTKTIDPWKVDSSRYREIEEVPGYTETEKKPGTGKKKISEETLIGKERTYSISNTSLFSESQKPTENKFNSMTAEERIAAMNKHREKNGKTQFESNAHVSLDRNKITEKREKSAKIKENTSLSSETEMAAPSKPQKTIPEAISAEMKKKQKKSFLARLLEWLKKFFSGK